MTVGPILHSIRTLQRAVRMASACTGLRAANCSRCFDRRARLLNCCVRPQVCTLRPAVASRRVSTAPIAIEQLCCLGRVSVFSHAPLEEFWQRVRRPKLCISLPCCSDFGAIFVQSLCQCCARISPAGRALRSHLRVACSLHDCPKPSDAISPTSGCMLAGVEPMHTYLDHEVFSEKKRIYIWHEA